MILFVRSEKASSFNSLMCFVFIIYLPWISPKEQSWGAAVTKEGGDSSVVERLMRDRKFAGSIASSGSGRNNFLVSTFCADSYCRIRSTIVW